jgi:hypothetical protein
VAYQYCIDPEINCVFVQHYDAVDYGEGLDAFDEVLQDLSFHIGLNILHDLSRADLPEILSEVKYLTDNRRRVAEIDTRLGQCRVAFVVKSADDFAIAHRISITIRPVTQVERKPFRDLGKAREWLGIPDDYEIKYPDAIE